MTRRGVLSIVKRAHCLHVLLSVKGTRSAPGSCDGDTVPTLLVGDPSAGLGRPGYPAVCESFYSDGL